MEEDNQYCRLCLSTSVVYYSLLKNNGKEMVLSLTGLEIHDDDPSTESCTKCWLDLKLAYFIQQCFIAAEKKLKGTFAVEMQIEEKEMKIEADPIEESTEIRNIDIKTENELDKAGDNDDVSNDEGEYPELIYIETEGEVLEEKSSPCSICGMKFIDEAKLYSHINTHYNGPQQCDECLMSLPNIPAYRDHIQEKHPKSYGNTHICGICSLSFKYKPLYELHLSCLHSETVKTGKRKNRVNIDADDSSLTCLECNKVFTNKRSFIQHSQHHVKKLCPTCGVKITGYNLGKHLLTHQTQETICDVCGITCKHIESLRWHKYYSHSNRKKLVCEQCGQEFKKLYTYKLHLKKHLGEKTFTCDTCGKRFFTRYRMNIHVKTTHLKERPHICKYCSQAFAKRDSMLIHERKHTKVLPYVCEICSEGFRQNISLRIHRKSKHDIEELKTAECDICKRMFKDNWALQSHVVSVHA